MVSKRSRNSVSAAFGVTEGSTCQKSAGLPLEQSRLGCEEQRWLQRLLSSSIIGDERSTDSGNSTSWGGGGGALDSGRWRLGGCTAQKVSGDGDTANQQEVEIATNLHL
ncbi:hypothetical protein PC111_g13038 [Phytophthora cactorum]|nr:hypothetical protein PC111_g13038 [Phytophthora cactorum]KAG3153388.1 hypothetical protein C6341_g15963 [Phytophthora cactorum]